MTFWASVNTLRHRNEVKMLCSKEEITRLEGYDRKSLMFFIAREEHNI